MKDVKKITITENGTLTLHDGRVVNGQLTKLIVHEQLCVSRDERGQRIVVEIEFKGSGLLPSVTETGPIMVDGYK